MIADRPTARTPLPTMMARAALSCAVAVAGTLALGASPAGADTNLGTVGGLTYIFAEQGPITAPGYGGGVAHCPAGTKVVGGGAEIGGNVAESRLTDTKPYRDAESKSAGWGAGTWNDSGGSKSIGVIAVCRQHKPAYRSNTAKVSVGHARTVGARCPRGTHVSGGGVVTTGTPAAPATPDGSYVNSSFPFDGRDAGKAPDDGWRARAYNISNAPRAQINVFAVCVTERPRYVTAGPVAMIPGTPSHFLISNAAACPGSRHISAGGIRLAGAPAANVRPATIMPFDLGDADAIPDDALRAKAQVLHGSTAASALMTAICM
jgi:hypothetical protein